MSIEKKVRIIKKPLHSIYRRGWHFTVGMETLEKPNSERLTEKVHPAGFAAGRNPEESPPNGGICERRTYKYAAVPPARKAYAPEGRGMRVTQQMGVFRQPH